MELTQLLRGIRLPEEVTQAVLERHAKLDLEALAPTLDQLMDPAGWESGLAALESLAPEDDRGMTELTVFLECARRAYDRYRAMGISDKIYFASMACFPRFVGEHLASFGCYGFDRGFWTVRQVSGMLFRIGQLEYELLTEKGENLISLHIPSDASLETKALRASYKQARSFFRTFFPAWAESPMVCESWLLSPCLPGLLPEGSRILAFQRSFRIRPREDDCEFALWVFKNPDLPPERYPEDTSLQRRLKAFVLSGGKFVGGDGTLINEPFTE